jgi:hypothetical protein
MVSRSSNASSRVILAELIQASATRATRRSAGPLLPPHTGHRRLECGEILQFVELEVLALVAEITAAQALRRISIVSQAARRVPRRARQLASNSSFSQPAPAPSRKRPAGNVVRRGCVGARGSAGCSSAR